MKGKESLLRKKCAGCRKVISPTEGAACSSCTSLYHRACVSLPDTWSISREWACPECKREMRRGDNSSTPVRGLAEGGTHLDAGPSRKAATATAAASAASSDDDDVSAPSDGTLAANAAAAAQGVQLIRREMAELAAELREFRREMEENRALVAGVMSRMDGVEQRLDQLERREAAPPTPAADVSDFERTVAQLRQELADRDQEALHSDLEIGHLPEERGENIVHAVTVLAAKLGVTLEQRDIVFAERVGAAPAPDRDSSGGAGAVMRERRVVVRLSRRHLRDDLLRAARVRRTLTAADAGHANSAVPRGRIFVNERLTRANRQLFHRAREECRRLQWRFSWTKRGRIYVRQADGKPAFPLRSEADIQRVFGPGPV